MGIYRCIVPSFVSAVNVAEANAATSMDKLESSSTGELSIDKDGYGFSLEDCLELCRDYVGGKWAMLELKDFNVKPVT